MKIVYNSPEHAKERQNVTPPSVEEMQKLVYNLNLFLMDAPKVKEKIQEVFFHYENLNHFYTVVGGWEGLENIKSEAYKEGYTDGEKEV